MFRIRPLCLTVALAVAMPACADTLLDDDPQAAYPTLSVVDDQVMLAWTESGSDGHRLCVAEWLKRGLDECKEIDRSRDWFVNWADFPAVLGFGDDALAAFVLEKRPGSAYSYGIGLRMRAGEREDWRAAEAVHDASHTEHGFASMWRWGGDAGIAWLDGRNSGSHGDGQHGAMNLRAARFDAQGRKLDEWLLDERTCDCCQTDAAVTDEGPVIVYRNRSEQEIRDIQLVRWQAGGWSEPVVVHEDRWLMPGCPVNGPAITARGHTVWVAWYTGADELPQVRLARSDDGGRSFGPPTTVASGEAVLGRVDVAATADGRAWVSWVSEDAHGQQLRLSRIDPEGQREDSTIAELGRGRGTGFPRMALTSNALWLAWTDTRSGSPRLRGQRLKLP